MDRRAMELLEKAETAEADMMDYLRSNASRLGERIKIYGITPGTTLVTTEYFLTPDCEIEIEKKYGNDELLPSPQRISHNNFFFYMSEFFREDSIPILKSAVEALGKELDKQQPPLPFRD